MAREGSVATYSVQLYKLLRVHRFVKRCVYKDTGFFHIRVIFHEQCIASTVWSM